MKELKVTILGSGCSTGVPRIDGYWGACDPSNPKNRRSRCSAWFSLKESNGSNSITSVIVDTSPDLRHQSLAAGIPHIDAVLWTHDHADQTHGIDDIRAFTYASGEPIQGFADDVTLASLRERFSYIFKGKDAYPPICRAHAIPEHGEKWQVGRQGNEIPVVTFDQEHGRIRSVGYRLGNIAYSSDVSDLSEDSLSALSGVQVWIVDALRHTPHPTHAHLERTLAWIEKVKPERAVLTNLHYDMDYETLRCSLPTGVEPAYDLLSLTTDL